MGTKVGLSKDKERMTIGAFLIARLGSSRLPGKNIMKILDRPMIELMAERVQTAKSVEKVIIATSTESSDDPLEELADKLGIGCYRGSLENIMERIHCAAEAHDCDTIIELLGDNPLVHSDLIDDVIKFYNNGHYDYAATVTHEYPVDSSAMKLFSIGIRVQVYSRSAAKKYIDYTGYSENDDKHPCSYIFDHPDRYKIGYFEARGKWAFMNKPDLTFAVNYRKNFNMVKAIFENNYPANSNFALEKVYDQLAEQKHLYDLMGSENINV